MDEARIMDHEWLMHNRVLNDLVPIRRKCGRNTFLIGNKHWTPTARFEDEDVSRDVCNES